MARLRVFPDAVEMRPVTEGPIGPRYVATLKGHCKGCAHCTQDGRVHSLSITATSRKSLAKQVSTQIVRGWAV